jgi:hypothetical protein
MHLNLRHYIRLDLSVHSETHLFRSMNQQSRLFCVACLALVTCHFPSNHIQTAMFKSFLRPRSKSSPEPRRPSTSSAPSTCIPLKLERMRLESKLYFPKKVVHAIDSRQDAVSPQLNFSFGDYFHVLSHKDIGGYVFTSIAPAVRADLHFQPHDVWPLE